ncbi:MAG: oligosaccharide flippase family protein [Bacteroidia bacterium]
MRKQKLYSILWSVMDVALYPVAYMLTLPYFMHQLGLELFGIWMLVNGFLISGQLFNFGIGTATLRNVSRFLSLNQDAEVSRTINSNLVTTLLIGVMSLIIGLGVIAGIQTWNWFSFRPEYRESVAYCLIITAPILTLKFMEQVLQNALRAHEKFVLSSVLSMCSRFSVLGINILLIAFKVRSIEWLLLVNLVILAGINLMLFLAVKRTNPMIHFGLHFSRQRVMEEIQYGKWTWMQSLMVILTYQSDRFLVMIFFGPATLAYYAIVSTMFNHIHMCYIALAPWLFPTLAKMKQQGEASLGQYIKIRSYILVLAVVSLWVFYLTNEFILKYWIGVENYAEISELITLFILFELLFVFTIVPYIYCNSSGFEKLYTKITGMFTSMNLAGMLAGCYFSQDVHGMVWGLVCTTLPAMMIQNYILNRSIFHQPVLNEALWVFLPPLLVAFAILSSVIMVQLFIAGITLYLLYRLYYLKIVNRDVVAG